MISGEKKKSWSSNRLVSVDSGIHYSRSIYIIKIFFTVQKDFSQLGIIQI